MLTYKKTPLRVLNVKSLNCSTKKDTKLTKLISGKKNSNREFFQNHLNPKIFKIFILSLFVN